MILVLLIITWGRCSWIRNFMLWWNHVQSYLDGFLEPQPSTDEESWAPWLQVYLPASLFCPHKMLQSSLVIILCSLVSSLGVSRAPHWPAEQVHWQGVPRWAVGSLQDPTKYRDASTFWAIQGPPKSDPRRQGKKPWGRNEAFWWTKNPKAKRSPHSGKLPELITLCQRLEHVLSVR